MTANSAPRVRRTAQNTQYTYNLSRRVHTVQTYPVLSPQGATIILYGHENGVTIVWRGGRRFKTAEPPTNGARPTRQNGKPPAPPANDAIMIIDSSDDEDTSSKAAPPFIDKPEFEDGSSEASESEITQTLDLSLGTDVFHISSPPMTPCPAENADWDGTSLLKEKMVFAVSCATREIYLVTLPLTPPSPKSKARDDLRATLLAGKAGSGKWGETLTLLSGQEKSSNALSLNLIKSKSTSDRSKSEDRSQSSSRPASRIVVAAHSPEASGTLRLWEVPVTKPSMDRPILPFQVEYLPNPLASISFNPTHPTQLLCISPMQAVRVYDYAQASMPPDDLSEGSFPSQGSWLISLYPPFARPSASRKPIIDAGWIAHGRAVLVLLADGQWGIWDIDGVSPGGTGLFGKTGSGIRGGALTSFSASGYIEGTSPLRNPGSQRSSGVAGEFVPMTPHSRREALTSAFGSERLAAVRGRLVVTPLPARPTTTSDESAVLWIGGAEHVIVIPGISKFWDAQLRRGSGGGVNLYSGAQPTRMVRLGDLIVGLMGERCIGVGAITKLSGVDLPSNEGLPIEVLLCGESRLVIVQDSPAVPGTRIGGIMGRKHGAARVRESSAIVVHPRPAAPASQMYNLSFPMRKRLPEGAETKASIAAASADDVLPSTETDETNKNGPSDQAQAGFDFARSLNAAADADEVEDEDVGDDGERAVEVEMLDIMEIDRELEVMDSTNGRGRKKVIFDS